MEDVTKHGNCTKAVTIYGSFGSDVNKHTFPNKEMLLSVVPRPLSAGRDTASSLSHSAFYDRMSNVGAPGIGSDGDEGRYGDSYPGNTPLLQDVLGRTDLILKHRNNTSSVIDR